jgi:phenylacetic acid degradation operon negative regulatory protein
LPICEDLGKLLTVKPETEELLYLLLWSCEQLSRPTFRNLTDSFESWAYRKGFTRGLAELERRKLIETRRLPSDSRVHRLTNEGRLLALGGRDPAELWSRYWDGQWRMVVFDVPLGQDKTRKRLVRYLHAKQFGCLQKSVWISPDALSEQRSILAGSEADPGALILLEAHPCAGETNEQIVNAAWDFASINRGYAKYLEALNTQPGSGAKELRRWAGEERAAWEAAVSVDPLLPDSLLPQDYLGKEAWLRRATVLERAAKQLRSFKGSE